MKDKRTVIAERISERGLTKKEVAERIGLHPSNLVSFLSGHRSIPFRKLELLEQILGL
jgi:transcriptional regulator with XRE-family HTH domain